MPSKSANVKNEKQYEALKDRPGGPDRELSRRLQARRPEERIRLVVEAGRDDRAEEGSRAQGREGDREEVLSVTVAGPAMSLTRRRVSAPSLTSGSDR